MAYVRKVKERHQTGEHWELYEFSASGSADWVSVLEVWGCFDTDGFIDFSRPIQFRFR